MGGERDGADTSVIGAGSHVEGTFESTGSLRIAGQLTGRISVEGEVSVSTDAVVEADIKAGSIILGGHLKGNLTAPGDVSLPAHSLVDGDVHARSVTALGTIKGDIVAAEKVELGPEARLIGDITCTTLIVAEGAVFQGQSVMGETPLHDGTHAHERHRGDAKA
jgi:cytoskeletal protein CcmA (bactofilin family)